MIPVPTISNERSGLKFLPKLFPAKGRKSIASAPAFTLVEIMIVVVIIGLLAAMAIPAFKRVQQKSRLSAFLNDLRVIESAVNMYAQEYGAEPPDYNIGVKPTELAPYLTKIDFTTPTQLGGLWDWDNTSTYRRISVVNGMSAENALLVDKAIDDGDLTTGRVTYDGTNMRYYLWQP